MLTGSHRPAGRAAPRTGRAAAAALVGLLAAAAAQAKLELRGFHLCDGPLGPIRRSAEYLPGEEFCVRYHVTGLTADDRGHARFASNEVVVDGAGTQYFADHGLLDLPLVCGPEGIAGSTPWVTTGTEPPGDYTYRLALTDLTTGELIRGEKRFTILPPRFGIAQVRCHRDAAKTVASPAGGYAGGTLTIAYRVTGADLQRPQLQIGYEILDAFREPTTGIAWSAVHGAAEHEAAGRPRDVPLELTFNLNAAGTFLLRILIKDLATGQEAVHEMRLRVEQEGGGE